MDRQFTIHGDIYKASVYGTTVYAIRDFDFAHRVLVDNWQNYVKGQSIARVALLLGKGLMVSKGDLWKRQRKMIQPAFTHDSAANSTKLITSVNAELLRKWQIAADRNESVNVTRDVSGMALEVMLRFLSPKARETVSGRTLPASKCRFISRQSPGNCDCDTFHRSPSSSKLE
jgi:cytochrome P450